MCRGCTLGIDVEQYLSRYSDPFERSAHELALAIKGIKWLRRESNTPHLLETEKRLKAVAQELSNIRDEFGTDTIKEQNNE